MLGGSWRIQRSVMPTIVIWTQGYSESSGRITISYTNPQWNRHQIVMRWSVRQFYSPLCSQCYSLSERLCHYPAALYQCVIQSVILGIQGTAEQCSIGTSVDQHTASLITPTASSGYSLWVIRKTWPCFRIVMQNIHMNRRSRLR